MNISLISSSVISFTSYLTSFLTQTVAYGLLLAAIVFYGYSLFNRAIPRFIIPPIIALCVSLSCYTLGQEAGMIKGTATERALWEMAAKKAQETYNKSYADLALELNALKSNYYRNSVQKAQEFAEERANLQAIISKLEDEENDTPEQPKQTFIYLPANKCMSTLIPDSVLHSINKAGSRKSN